MTLVITKPFPARYRSGGAGNARPGNPSEWELNSSGSAIGSFALVLATSEMGIGSGNVHVRSPFDRQCWHWFSWDDRVGASFGSVLESIVGPDGEESGIRKRGTDDSRLRG